MVDSLSSPTLFDAHAIVDPAVHADDPIFNRPKAAVNANLDKYRPAGEAIRYDTTVQNFNMASKYGRHIKKLPD